MFWLRLLVLVFGHACLIAPSAGQVVLPGGTAPGITAFSIPGQPAREAFVVAPGKMPTKASQFPTVRLQSEVLGQTETVDGFLSRHNLADDDKNRTMLRALNPRFDLTKGVIQAGSKVEVFSVSPQNSAQTANLRYAFDSPNLTQYAFHTQVTRVRELSEVARALPTKAFNDPSIAKVHVQATADLRTAAETLESRSDKLSKLDFSVAQFQVEYASKQAAMVNASASTGVVPSEQILAASESARAAKSTADRVQSGKPAIDVQTLDVNVFKGNSSEHVKPLQVYVIPSGALSAPQLWTTEQLQSFLSDFSFANDASPVSQAIPMNFDPRVCIGPKNAIKGMAELVAARKLTTCRKPEVTVWNTKAVLIFRSPDDVARP